MHMEERMRATLATRDDLPGIIELQRANLEANARDPVGQGFVTVVHTLDVLERMHALAPSVVVRDAHGALAGYALVMLQECEPLVPVLGPMFANLRTLSWRGRPIAELRFYVMGQVCVAEASRGQGVFDALYAGHAAHYGARFDLVITEVAMRNTRSLRAHARVGFETLEVYRDDVDEWGVVAWNFVAPPKSA
jgi:GNAT superfamily N-acetyltransferase